MKFKLVSAMFGLLLPLTLLLALAFFGLLFSELAAMVWLPG